MHSSTCTHMHVTSTTLGAATTLAATTLAATLASTAQGIGMGFRRREQALRDLSQVLGRSPASLSYLGLTIVPRRWLGCMGAACVLRAARPTMWRNGHALLSMRS